MNELFPLLAGVCIGFIVQRIVSIHMRNLALFALSMLAGFTASYISGELFVSWDFLLFDIPLVFLGAIATSLVLTWQQSRHLPR